MSSHLTMEERDRIPQLRNRGADQMEIVGLRHSDSSANLVRRAKKREQESALFRRQIARAESQLAMKTEKRG